MSEAVVRRACSKLRSAIGDEAVVRLNFIGDLQEMLVVLEVLLEAARMQPLERATFMRWMQQVRHAAYMIMDMVDELQHTRPPAAATVCSMTRMVPLLAIKKNSMATKLKEMKRELLRLAAYWDSFSFMEWPQPGQQQAMDARKKAPFSKEVSIIGRGSDKQRIVALLLSAASNITQGPNNCTILPIFGFPGSGKTTLAEMVFNDDTHSLHEYNFRIWVHVSPELDFHRIDESILRQVLPGGGGKEGININGSISDVVGMESTMKHLHELLRGQKVLLVLDDLWEEDPIQLQMLKSRLTSMINRVDVIVTTCNQDVARKVCTVEPYRLNPLDDDACWEIIKKSIHFEEEDQELETIGREIARKCQGLPPVALQFASMLNSRDPTRWAEVMRKDMCDVVFGAHSQHGSLLSAFEFSYIRMPPDVRLCFGYLAVLPNGQNIVKDDLIRKWRALHIIEPSERLSATQIADKYITQLLDMSFLQTTKLDPAKSKDDKGTILFTIHYLVHAYARLLTDCMDYRLIINWGWELDNQYSDYLRALSCVGCSKVEFKDDLFSSTRCLRVLELKESSVQKLPDSIYKLKHLGYLNISKFNGLVTLPESFGHLINVFHIDLSGCSGLVNLPESFGNLICLVHVNLSGCTGLGSLPESFGNLTNLSHLNLSRCHALAEIPEPLQKLGKLVHLDLSFWSCFEGIGKGLSSLTNLEHLNLCHPCCHLAQQRSNLEGLKDGLCKLTRLRYLNLSMCLNPIFYYQQSQEECPQYIGDCFAGLSNLEHLDLSQNTFLFYLPECLGDLDKLHTLDVSGCIRLKNIAKMKSLKFIALRNCRGLESCNFVVRIVDDDDEYRSSSNIVQLEDVDCKKLQISCLEKVRSKEEAQRIKLADKQKLRKLKLSWTLDSIRSVEDSALLGVLTPPLNVQCLEINGYDGTCLPEYLGELISLQELKIVCCKQLNSLPDNIKELTGLKVLFISGCQPLEKWCQLEENKKMLAHIPEKNYEGQCGASSPESEEDCRSIVEVEAA